MRTGSAGHSHGYLAKERLTRTSDERTISGKIAHDCGRYRAFLLLGLWGDMPVDRQRPFHVINYLGGCGGALVFHGRRLTRLLDRTMERLHRRLDAETDESLGRRIHFPVEWYSFFDDTMTVADVYHYGTQHYDFHRGQLTLEHRG